MGLFGGAIIQPTTAPPRPIDTQSGVPSSTGSPPGREPPAFCHHSCPAHIFPTTLTPTLLRYLLFILQLRVQLQYCYFPDTPAQVRNACLRAPELTFGAPVSKSMCLCNYRLNGNLGKGRSLHVILLCLIQPDTHRGRSWAWHESSRYSQSYDLWGCLVKSSTYIKTQEPTKQTAISNMNPGGTLRADPRSRGISCGLATTPTVAILQGRQALCTGFVHAAGPARG